MRGLQIPGYELHEVIGRGGMGSVVRGTHQTLRREVAIKLIHPMLGHDPEALERFLREARTLASLMHENIVLVHDAGVADETPYLVMEMLKGESLATRLDTSRVSESQAVEIVSQILNALAVAHRNGVVHRDIKPANIWLMPSGQVKLLDFGIARALDGTHATTTGVSLGTPAYMSPEQAEGVRVEPRSDLYSVGIVLYQLLAGYLPFRAESSIGLMRMHLDVAPPPLPEGIHPGLARIVLKSLSKRPDGRHPDAESMRADLMKVSLADRAGETRNSVTRWAGSDSGSAEGAAKVGIEKPTSGSQTPIKPGLPKRSDVARRALPAPWFAVTAVALLGGLGIGGSEFIKAVFPAEAPKGSGAVVSQAYEDPPSPDAVAERGLRVQLQFANRDDAYHVVIGRPLNNVGLTIEADPKIVSLADVSVVDDNGIISPPVRRARVEREPGARVFVLKFPILVKKSLLLGGDAAFPLSITFGATPVFANYRKGAAISLVLPPYPLRLEPPKQVSQSRGPSVSTREGRSPRTRPQRNPPDARPNSINPSFRGTDN